MHSVTYFIMFIYVISQFDIKQVDANNNTVLIWKSLFWNILYEEVPIIKTITIVLIKFMG